MSGEPPFWGHSIWVSNVEWWLHPHNWAIVSVSIKNIRKVPTDCLYDQSHRNVGRSRGTFLFLGGMSSEILVPQCLLIWLLYECPHIHVKGAGGSTPFSSFVLRIFFGLFGMLIKQLHAYTLTGTESLTHVYWITCVGSKDTQFELFCTVCLELPVNVIW